MLKSYKVAIITSVLLLLALTLLYYYPYKIAIPFQYSCDASDKDIDNYAKLQAVRALAYDQSKDFCKIDSVDRIKESRKSQTFDSQLYRNLPNIRKIVSDPKIMEKRNAYLAILVDNRSSLLDLPFSRQKSNLLSNINKISQYLSYSKIYTEMVELTDGIYRLTITPDSNSIVYLTDLNADIELKGLIEVYSKEGLLHKIDKREFNTFFLNNKMHIGLDNNLEIEARSYSYIIKGANLKVHSIRPEYVNTNTQLKVPLRDNSFVLVNRPEKFSFDYINQSIQELVAHHNNVVFQVVDQETLQILEGEYFINKDIVIPYGVSLSIAPGVVLNMSQGASIVVYGGVDIRGKPEKPIIIRNSKDGHEFGVFSAIGDGKTNVRIENLIISGGSETSVNGSYFSGALSLYDHQTVQIRHSKIYNNIGSDGVNIKNAKVILKDNLFYLNSSDQVDLDYCMADVTHNVFSAKNINSNWDKKNFSDSNGDGLDLSGSKVFLHKNTFSDFSDKGVSVGEYTKLNSLKNSFYRNNIGIAVKDQSQALLSENNFKENKNSISMYIKKGIFNSPELFILDCNKLKNANFQEGSRVFCGKDFNKDGRVADISNIGPLFFQSSK